MPPTARIPAAEFRSLLLAPIRVRLCTLNSYFRPQCASTPLHRPSLAAACLTQRRSLHLYKTARAKTTLGMHKILSFNLYEIEPPSASKHKVNLVESVEEPQKIVKEDVTLQELYDGHISPGRFLHMVEGVSKALANDPEKMRELDGPSTRKTYTIVDVRAPSTNKSNAPNSPEPKEKSPNQPSGPLKGARMLLSNPPEFTRLVFDRSYHFIEAGSPVEFAIRAFGPGKDKKFKPEAALGIQKWLHEHFPHLRPDFILKSMPEGTEFLIKPVTNGGVVQFVLGRRPVWMGDMDLTKRAFRVRGAVEATMDKNHMAQSYQQRKEKNEAKERGTQADDLFRSKDSVAVPLSTKENSFEVGKTGSVSREAAEKQKQVRIKRDNAKLLKQQRREVQKEGRGDRSEMKLYQQLGREVYSERHEGRPYHRKQSHRWQGRGSSRAQ